jgi:hypothetical protein
MEQPKVSAAKPDPVPGLATNVTLADVPLGPSAPPAQMELAAELNARRGDEMLAVKDIPAARTYYAFAAIEGSARAAVALAQTYDPSYSIKPVAATPAPKPVAQVVRRRRPARVETEDSDEVVPQGASPAGR